MQRRRVDIPESGEPRNKDGSTTSAANQFPELAAASNKLWTSTAQETPFSFRLSTFADAGTMFTLNRRCLLGSERGIALDQLHQWSGWQPLNEIFEAYYF